MYLIYYLVFGRAQMFPLKKLKLKGMTVSEWVCGTCLYRVSRAGCITWFGTLALSLSVCSSMYTLSSMKYCMLAYFLVSDYM